MDAPRYVHIKSLETLSDGRQCLTYVDDGEEKELAANAIMRMLVPKGVPVTSLTTLRLELVPAHQVVDL